MVISSLMNELSPYEEDSISGSLMNLMLEQRFINFMACNFEKVLNVMAENFPEQYDDTQVLGDS